MSHGRSISQIALIVAAGLVAGLSAAPAQAQTALNLNALSGLAPFSALLNTSAGQAALASNYTVTGAIQNGTSSQPTLYSTLAAQRSQAISDATLTTTNAYQLADGLGTKLGAAYQSLTSYKMTNLTTGAASWTGISTNVNNLINYTYSITGSDSNSGKYFFANLTTNGATPVNAAAQAIMSAAGGTTDVFGKAYGLPAGSTGADAFGDSRPFQTLKTLSIFSGVDFNGAASSNQYYLTGAPSSSIYGQNLTNSPAFPSGHTTYGYTESLLLAILVPQRYQQMIARGAEYGNNRIIMGAHYAMDVLAGRTLAYYDIAQMLANNAAYLTTVTYTNSSGTPTTVSLSSSKNYTSLFSAAQSDLTAALSSACGASVATCATQDSGIFSNNATLKAFYETTQTYGLATVYSATANKIEDVNTIAPEAGYLLMTRFPYLTQAQRNDILTSTEGAGGGFLDNGSAFGLYSRLDLFMAAGGYGSFSKDVSVTMDASKGGYYAADVWSNDISGVGGLTLNGTGQLTLSGSDSYKGATIVNGGLLEVSGSIQSPTTINAGGALAGAGTVGAVTVNKGGVLAPGGVTSNGNILGVVGNLTFNAGSTLLISAVPTAATGVSVKGAAQINGGNVQVAAANGDYARSTTYDVLSTSGGVTGTFSSVSSNLTFLTPVLTYGTNDVWLSLARNNVSYASVAATGNQRAVGASLDLVNWNAASQSGASVLNALDRLTAAGAQNALDQIGGAGIAAANTVALNDAAAFSGAIADQAFWGLNGAGPDVSGISHVTVYADLPSAKTPINVKAPERDWRVWGEFLGGGSTYSANGGQGTPSANSSGYGGLAGLDYKILPNAIVGVALGGSTSNFSVNALSTSGTTSAFDAGVYGIYGLNQGYYVQASGTFAAINSNATRYASFGGLGLEKLNSSFSGTEARGRIEIGRSLTVYGQSVTPFVAQELAGLWTGSFNENSWGGVNALALSNGGQSITSAPLFLGVKWTGSSSSFSGWSAQPNVTLAWVHEFSPDRSLTSSLIALPTTDFTVYGPRAAENAAQVKAGFQLVNANHMTIFAQFNGEFANGANSYGGQGGVRYNF